MYILDNYGFFIFLGTIILIIFYLQNGNCLDIRKNIKEGFKNNKSQENFVNSSKINISDINYLGSCFRKKDFLALQKEKKRYEIPLNCYNEGYISLGEETPIVPILSHPTLNFHHPYGPNKELC